MNRTGWRDSSASPPPGTFFHFLYILFSCILLRLVCFAKLDMASTKRLRWCIRIYDLLLIG